MRKLLTYATAFAFLMASLIAIVHGVTQRLESNSILVRIFTSDRCAQACWHGIQPGLTSVGDAYDLLKADTPLIDNLNLGPTGREVPPEQALCWSIAVTPRWRGCVGRNSTFSGLVNLIELSPPANVFTLGQAIGTFGEPVAVEMCHSYGRIFFAQDVEVIVAGRRTPALDPQQNVLLVRFLYPGSEPPYRFDIPSWRGFIIWHDDIYC